MNNSLYLRKALNSTGLYDTDNKNINAEISAYEAGLYSLASELDRVIGKVFISTSGEEDIIERMSLFRNYVDKSNIEALRKQLKEKAILRNSSLIEMKERLKAAGIKGEITESLNNVNIKIASYENIEPETAINEIKKYLPVHVSVNFT